MAEKAVVDFESGNRTAYPTTFEAMQRAFEAAGVDFIPENGGGAGVRMRKASK